MEVTNSSASGVPIWEPVFEDNTLLAAGALTYAVGTVLGRITASGKLTHYASGSIDGSEVPIAVLTVAEVYTGAGDKAIRALVGGQVRRGDLIAHGVGALTQAEVDALRDYSITALVTTQLGELDNQ